MLITYLCLVGILAICETYTKSGPNIEVIKDRNGGVISVVYEGTLYRAFPVGIYKPVEERQNA